MGSINVKIVGGNSEHGLHEQEIHVKAGPKQGKSIAGAIVYTDVLRNFDTQNIPFFNPSYGIAMNQSVTFSGTPINIHNGEDKVQWDANSIVGGTRWDPDDNNAHAKDAVINVLDYTGLSGETITISINTVVTVITEGTDYDAITSNDVTAANIATAFDALLGINASSSSNVVTLLAQDTYDIDNLTENSAGSDLTVSARSIQATATNNNDVLELITTGVDVDLSNYSTLTGWIYLTGWDTGGTKDVELEFWLDGSIAPSTVKVSIGSVINTTLFNQWQKFTFSLGNFQASSSMIDSIRIRNVDIGGGAPVNFWMDYIQIQEIGEPIEFSLAVPKDAVFHMDTLRFTLAAPLTGDVPNNLSFDSLMGLDSLTTGFTLKRVQRGVTQFSLLVKDIGSLMEAGADLINSVSDGVNTYATYQVKFNEELFTLQSNNGDSLTITINDDLSSLLKFTVFAIGRIEI